MLTETQLKSLKPKARLYKITDRDGLYIAVLPGGTKSYRYNYIFNGKQQTITIGKYTSLTLAQARTKLNDIKKQLAQGINPSAEKKLANPHAKSNTQHTLAKWFEIWKNRKALAKGSTDAAQRALKRLGDIAHQSMFAIRTQDIRNVVETIKKDSPSSARLFLIYVRAIFQYAIDNGLDIHNPVASIKVSTIGTMPVRDRVLNTTELKQIYQCFTLKKYEDRLQPILLKLLLLTLARKSELLQAAWSEMDFEQQRWVIPASRMKNKRTHIVYLSTQAIELFKQAQQYTKQSPWVFSQTGKKPPHRSFLDKFVISLVKQNKLGHFTAHDIRRTASTLLNEMGYPNELVEASLSHYQTGIKKVYNHANYRDQRLQMMQEWADKFDEMTKGVTGAR